MRILLTNDDGIMASGITALHQEVTSLGEVYTIAPLTVQSATSHGVTFNEPLMIQDTPINGDPRGVAVDGRPADCVKLAITSIWPDRMGDPPDVVISGMNQGVNVGIHVIYSGTVAAAIEGAFLGVPAIAVSLHISTWKKTRFDVAARHAREVIDRILAANALEPHTVLNMNLPVTESDGPLPPVHVVPMNLSGMRDKYDRRTSPGGQTYFWAAGDGLDFHNTAEGSDLEAIFNRNITVTPLKYDLTDHERLAQWRNHLNTP